MYCIIWKQSNQFDKFKKYFPAASSTLPRDRGTPDGSMPKLVFLEVSKAEEIRKLCYGTF